MKKVGTRLTAGEREALISSARGLTNGEIAERLGMSVAKVKTLIHQAAVKLGAHTRYSAAIVAIMQGRIRLDEIFSLDELAEYLGGLAPDVLSKIARVVREGNGRGILTMIEKDIPHIDREQDTILTKRERDVLILVGRGLTNKEIAEKLGISVCVVKSRLSKASSNLGARSRGDALILALKQRDIEISEVLSIDVILQSLAQLDPESLEKIARVLSKNTEL